MFLLSGCKAVGPDYERPQIDTPQTFRFLDENTSNNGFCCVVSIGGTGDLVPTVNARQSFNAATTYYISSVYDPINQKVRPTLSHTKNRFWSSFWDQTIWISLIKRQGSGSKMKELLLLSRKYLSKGSECSLRLILLISEIIIIFCKCNQKIDII